MRTKEGIKRMARFLISPKFSYNFPRKKASKSLCKSCFQTYIYLGIYSFHVSQGVKRQMDYAKEERMGQTQFL